MSFLDPRPLIGLTACRLYGAHGLPIHKVSESYIAGVMDGAGGLPLMLPAVGERLDVADLDRILASLDGLLVTGSPSNVDPVHYDGDAARLDSERDPARDATTLPLLGRAIERAVPVLAICRGIQELNVAFGGTLHQHVEEVPGRLDHRSDKSMPMAQRFDKPAHHVTLTEDGVVQRILGGVTVIEVNTLHGQAIDRPGDRIAIEAVAPDGTIEAVSVADAPAFAIGIQWHPEWRVLEDPHARALFAAFGDACRSRAELKTAQPPVAV
ncbi:MAG: gamma-glutamyl-gamma-aminobutyrate hydrolase family protein [Geminicoccales bacterium]